MVKATIAVCPIGVFGFSEEKQLIEKALFSKKPAAAARSLLKAEGGKMVSEIESVVTRLQKGTYDVFVFENENLAKEVRQKLGVATESSEATEVTEALCSNMSQLAVEAGFAKGFEEFNTWMHNVSMEIAKLRVKGAVEKRDLLVAQAIQMLDDLDKVINLFMGRLREWYGIHFPELDRLVDKHETYARLVLVIGNRDGYALEMLEKEGVPQSKAQQIVNSAENSMGADLEEEDLARVQEISRNILDLFALRQTLEAYLDKTMEEVAPNTKILVGSLLGARLIAIAGGLTNLARKPASTIQVLGAEKALFRSMKTGTRPPKHGLIFQHGVLHDAKKWQRGKIARAVAGKLAIAARADAFGGRMIGEELKSGLEKRIKEIQEKYVEPPPIEERKPKHEKRMRSRRRREY
ncbi:MAG: C/D box methylation guide ribonucleoprotein complex aNOP56 subunit [Candidatus Bathyarchaeota archaeon]|nr:C/D box methylation guide ribonucleoprotein complex aNOP56 subunit [Candidatus Bathyarchaeota archaeon]